ncbi:hypothetical protein AcW1_003650 [Taiwanofungus camphoratus]|nr:hypothetical protein AcW1_003650 [Antrodia cinnamomea]
MTYSVYVQLLKNDVIYHNYSVDGGTWPLNVRECGARLRSAFRLPSWVKNGPYPPVDRRVQPLLYELQASDSSTNVLPENEPESQIDQRLRDVFNTTLSDCVSLRNAIISDYLCNKSSSKESFLAVMVRNAMCPASNHYLVDEDACVALPRHGTGVFSPLLKYMQMDIRVPLMVSVGMEVSCSLHPDGDEPEAHESNNANGHAAGTNGNGSGGGESNGDDHGTPEHSGGEKQHSEGTDGQHGDEKETSSTSSSKPRSFAGPGLSTFMAMCNRPVYVEVPEEEPEEDQRCRAELDAHVLAYSTSKPLPRTSALPILCMAEETSLPVHMSSMLYQRHVWQVSEPLIGLAFSKTGSSVRVYFGWLDKQSDSGRILPQVHLGCIEQYSDINVSDPCAALALCQYLLCLADCASEVRNAACRAASADSDEIRQGSVLQWRLDACIEKLTAVLVRDRRERILAWIEGSSHKAAEGFGNMAPKSTKSSAPTSASKSRKKSLDALSSPPSATSETQSSIPSINAPDGDGGSRVGSVEIPKHLSCSDFARKAADNDALLILNWLFDRKAVLRSVLSDEVVQDEHKMITEFMWPREWVEVDDMSPVDSAHKSLRQDLYDQVRLHLKKAGTGAKELVDVPPDVKSMLVSSFSAIFQACANAQVKAHYPGSVAEVSWRHDNDRLFFDFFTGKGGEGYTLSPGTPKVTPEAPPADPDKPLPFPSLERMLQFPRNIFVDLDKSAETEAEDFAEYVKKTQGMENKRVGDWTEANLGPSTAAQRRQLAIRQELDDSHYVMGEAYDWMTRWRRLELLTRMGQAPHQGKCDALGTLHVPIAVAEELLKTIRLANLAPYATPYESQQSPQSRPDALSPPQTKRNSNTIEGGTNHTYIMVASTKCPSRAIHNHLCEERKGSVSSLIESLKGLAFDCKDSSESAILELPLIVIEYKKASYSQTQGENQHRLYFTALLRFLEAIGITDYPIYSVLAEGPQATLSSARINDGVVHIFERHTLSFDISTAIGAWHYATVLCRIAIEQSKELYRRFTQIKDNLVARLQNEELDVHLKWTHAMQVKEVLDKGEILLSSSRKKS